MEKVTKTILVDAIHCFVIKEQGIFNEMHELLETYPNKKILLTGANDDEFKNFGLDKMPYEVFTLKHNLEKTNPKYYETLLERFKLSKDNVVYFEHNPEAVKNRKQRFFVSQISIFGGAFHHHIQTGGNK